MSNAWLTPADKERIESLPVKHIPVDGWSEYQYHLWSDPEFYPVTSYCFLVEMLPGELGLDEQYRYVVDGLEDYGQQQ